MLLWGLINVLGGVAFSAKVILDDGKFILESTLKTDLCIIKSIFETDDLNVTVGEFSFELSELSFEPTSVTL